MKYYLNLDVLSEQGPQQIASVLENIAKQIRRDVSWCRGSEAESEYWFELKTIPRTPSLANTPTE